MVTSTITPAEVGGLVAAPVGFMRPKDIQRLAEMHSGATTVQIANLSFGGWTEPVYAATALAAKDAELDGAVFLKDAAEAALRKREVEINKLHVQLAEARKALDRIERKICAAEHGHTINDVLANYREVRRTVQDARAARRALTGGKDDG